MSTWVDSIDNPEILACYEQPPSLQEVELLSIAFAPGMNSLDVDLLSSELPTRRWTQWSEKTNAMALSLQFSGELRTSIATAAPLREPVAVFCDLKKHGDGIVTLDCQGQGVNVSVECTTVRVSGLMGFVNGTPSNSEVLL